MSGILVVCETRRGELRDVSLELVAAGLALAEQGAGEVTVAVVDPDPESHASAVAFQGVKEVVGVRTPDLEPDAWAMETALESLMDDLRPAAVLVPHTADGQGYAPALAARLGLGFCANALVAGWSDGSLTAKRGLYGDRVVASLRMPGPASLVTLRPGGTSAPAAPAATPFRQLEVAFDVSARPTEHLGWVEPESGEVDITKADFLLSVGRGADDEDGIEDLREVADRVGATLSASRPLVDAGWVESARQVGQSGRSVKPKVYLALGISGAIQHLAGIREAGTVIAVNTDPAAPIFKQADYGAVADLFEVAEALPRHLG